MSILRPALTLLILFTLLTGIAYPLATTGLAQLLFPHQASGSPILQGGRIIGSELIGQNFTTAGYFHGRPSAAGSGYDASASSGSNFGPTSHVLVERVATEVALRQVQNPGVSVPADLLLASGSGLDPHISPEAAAFQIPRVAAARGLAAPTLQALVAGHTEARTLGLLGEPRVNVLALNLALSRLALP